MKTLYTFLACLLAVGLTAQTDCPCCDEAHKQFDFWVGNWTVTSSEGTILGDNKIVKMDGDCLIMERWTGNGGVTGRSMNYYDATDASWNQLWVDNQGTILKLKGQLTGGKMVLKSDLSTGPNGDMYYNQITWSPESDGSVIQLWELFNQGGEQTQVLFKGIYRKKE